MFKVDDKFLQEVGLSELDHNQEYKQQLTAHIKQVFAQRLGKRMTESLTDTQLLEFENIMQQQNRQQAMVWLQNNVPNYLKVFKAEEESLKTEIKQAAPAIIKDLQQDSR